MTHTKSEILEACKAVAQTFDDWERRRQYAAGDCAHRALALLDAIDAATVQATQEITPQAGATVTSPIGATYHGVRWDHGSGNVPGCTCQKCAASESEPQTAREAMELDGKRRESWRLYDRHGYPTGVNCDTEASAAHVAATDDLEPVHLVELRPGERICRGEPAGCLLKNKRGESLVAGMPGQHSVGWWDSEIPDDAPHTLVPLYEESDG